MSVPDRAGPVVWKAENTLDGVDGEHDWLRLEAGPGYVDLELVNVA